MPVVIPFIVAAIADYAAGAIIAYLGIAAGTFAAIAVQFFVAFAVSALASKLFKTSQAPVPGDQGRLQTLTAPIAARRVVYGEMRVGTQLVYAQTSGDKNALVHLIGVVGQGEMESISDGRFWIGERRSDDPAVAGRVYLDVRLGTVGQPPIVIPELAWEWTPNCTLDGIAYAYTRFTFDKDGKAFPNGIPSCTFQVKGLKLFDPRDGGTRWSDNAALVILDYLRSEEHGMGATDDLVDFDSFRHAADVCDEQIPCFDNARPTGTAKRYAINGVINLDAAPSSTLDALELACAGQLVFSGGKYRLYVGEYVAPTVTIDERWLRDTPSIRLAPSRAQQFNIVRGDFVDPFQDWQQSDFPQVENQQQIDLDESELPQSMSLSLVSSPSQAQRLAKLDLYRNSQDNSSSLHLPLNWMGLSLGMQQSVRVKGFAPLGDRSYRVVEWTLAQGGGVDVTLQEETPDMYEWDAWTDQDIARTKATTPPIYPWPIVQNLTSAKDSYDNLQLTWAHATWGGTTDHYEIQTAADKDQWQPAGTCGSAIPTVTFSITSGVGGISTVVRVRAIGQDGTVGPWAYSRVDTGAGGSMAPRRHLGDSLGVALTAVNHGVQVAWNNNDSAGGYEIAARPAQSPAWTVFQVPAGTTTATVGESTSNWTADGSTPDDKTYTLSDVFNGGITVRMRAVAGGVAGYWSKPQTLQPLSKDGILNDTSGGWSGGIAAAALPGYGGN